MGHPVFAFGSASHLQIQTNLRTTAVCYCCVNLLATKTHKHNHEKLQLEVSIGQRSSFIQLLHTYEAHENESGQRKAVHVSKLHKHNNNMIHDKTQGTKRADPQSSRVPSGERMFHFSYPEKLERAWSLSLGVPKRHACVHALRRYLAASSPSMLNGARPALLVPSVTRVCGLLDQN